MDEPETAAGALHRLSETTGERYALVGRLAGGETGAHEARGPDGTRLVVKWDDDPESQRARRRGVELTRRLGERAGWPVPRQWTVDADGRLYVLQELLAGTPVARWTHPLVDAVLDLHRRRIGIAADLAPTDWPDHLIETLVVGGRGYCLHAGLRGYDARTRALVERIEAIGTAVDPADLAGTDVVHWDLHPGNLLQVDGTLTAVVDNDFAITGDAAFDLVTLALTSRTLPCDDGVPERLAGAAFDGLSDARRGAYVGHLLLRFCDWSIRKGRTGEVDLWLGEARRLLPT